MNNIVWIVLASMLAGGVVDRIFAAREWRKFYEGQDSVEECVQRAIDIKSNTSASRRKSGVDDRTPR